MLRKLIAIGLGLMGAVYFGQGTGLFTPTTSFMNNNMIWAIIGIAEIIVALIIWPRAKASS
jgi:hypothetical protein